MMKPPATEDSVPFLEHDNDDIETRHIPRKSPTKLFRPFWWLFGIITIFIVTNIISIIVSREIWSRKLDQTCAIHTSQHKTPIFRDVRISYESIIFNGSFSKETIYRQKPSPEVDEAWLELGIEYDPLIVADEDAKTAGIEQNRFHVTERYGGPGYPAFVAGLHQLHCLNLIRKSLYFNVDYYRALHKVEFLDRKEILELHIGHCVDVLRQRLMCTADTELHPYIWAGDPPHVTPDFNRMYKCRNFGDIREYAQKKQATWGPKGPDVVPEVGALILDAIP